LGSAARRLSGNGCTTPAARMNNSLALEARWLAAVCCAS
jgi:hypothetical protein